MHWHRRRFAELAQARPDLLACETIPSAAEARALATLVEETPDVWAWFSFSCRDGTRISDGTPLRECARELDQVERVAAIGVNCTAPEYVESLIGEIASVSDKPIVVYPNSGQRWDATSKTWQGEAEPVDPGPVARAWHAAGASLIGGCCRTRPEYIRRLRQAFA